MRSSLKRHAKILIMGGKLILVHEDGEGVVRTSNVVRNPTY